MIQRRNLKELVKIASVAGVLIILLLGALMLRQLSRKKSQVARLSQQTAPVGAEDDSGMVEEELPEEELADFAPSIASPYPMVGKYMLVPDKNELKVGQTFELNTVFSALGKLLDGSDVILRFDPSFLQALKIVEGDYFSSYPRKKIDNKKGIIKITGIRPREAVPLASAVFYSKIVFIAKQAGSTKVTFDFIKGKTNRTTLVEKGTSQNILGSVFPADISIE